MNTKRVIAEIVLKNGKLIEGLQNSTVLSDKPVQYAKSLAEKNVDEILIYELSQNDSEHDEAIGIIKEICTACQIPVIGNGHIFRMEDVKKLLYAGCKKVLLDYSKAPDREITEEVSKKFGKDKLVVKVSTPDEYNTYKDTISAYFCEVYVEFNAAPDFTYMKKFSNPIYSAVKEVLKDENLSAVVFPGSSIADNEVIELKHECFINGISVYTFEGADSFDTFKLNSDGLLPVVVQDDKTSEVLMMAYMNKESYESTLKTGRMTYFSRSRQSLWLKGETSGHFQYVKSLTIDCDRDTLLAVVSQTGAACHTGNHSCFYTPLAVKECDETNPLKVFENVFNVILDRKIHPKEGSYTNYLFDKGIDKILKKLGEEATEIVIAAKNPNPDEIKYEISDFLYHMMVLMAEKNVTWEEITTELARR